MSVISGASTVPGLSSAVLAHYKDHFKQIDSLVYGITPGQKTERGLATTRAILSYLGKPLKPANGSKKIDYGWQQIYRQHYPELGQRWMASCDIPDLDLFPHKYGIKHIQFSAGMESSPLHLGMWVASWCIRLKLPINLIRYAPCLLKFSHWFDRFGTANGGMHMIIKGMGHDNRPKTIAWYLIANQGHGPQIPITPAVILAQKMRTGCPKSWIGAQACVGLVTLEDYLSALSELDIKTYVTGAS